MTVHQPLPESLPDDHLETTAGLRGALQDDIARLQAIIRSADQTIQRARLAIVQLSLQEDRKYAVAADLAEVQGQSSSVS